MTTTTQLCLPFDPAEETELTQERLRLASSVRAPRTLLGYASDWRDFSGWCAQHARAALPANAATVALYITDFLKTHKVTTAERHVSSIAHRHRIERLVSPCDPSVYALLIGARRLRCEKPDQKAAITVEHLRQLYHQQPDNKQEARNRAILLLGFATALRRSNLTALDLSDLEFQQAGIVVRVRKEKQDQLGEGREIAVTPGHGETCPVAGVREWLTWRGMEPGPLFVGKGRHLKRLHPNTISQVVKRAVQRIGLDPRGYAGHSLRAGMVTTAVENGVNEFTIAATTGHRSLEVLRRYFRRTSPFRACACASLGM